MEIGEIYEKKDMKGLTRLVLIISNKEALCQTGLDERKFYSIEDLQNNYNLSGKLFMSGENVQRLNIRYMRQNIKLKEMQIKQLRKELADMKRQKEAAEQVLQELDEGCTDCLASNMNTPDCKDCHRYQFAMKGVTYEHI